MDSNLFPKGMSAEQIVKRTLIVLMAQRVKQPLIQEPDLEKMAAVYEALLSHFQDPGQALAHLTQYLEAILDGKPHTLPPGSEG